MQRRIRQFLQDDSGATAIEYGLIVGLIAIALISAFMAFGNNVTAMFGHIEDTAGGAMENATSGT